jgi:hypothetical protein
LDVSYAVIEFIVIFGVLFQRFERNRFRSIESSFHNDEESEDEQRPSETCKDIIQKTPCA